MKWKKKIFASYSLDRISRTSKIFKELKNQTPKEPIIQVINGLMN
jgi:hypothetical protein